MKADNRPKFSVVIPVFNEEENLEVLHTRLVKVMESLEEPYEIIFVDDGSTDSSFQILKDLHQKDNSVKVIRFTRNFGQHPAITAGFDFAQGEKIITLDADLQNPPEEISKLLSKLDEGYDIIFGVFPEGEHSPFRKMGSLFANWVRSKILPGSTSRVSTFRAIRSEVIKHLSSFSERSKFLDGLLCWTGFRIGTVEVKHLKRERGKTKYGFFRLVGLWFDMVTSFTNIPLRIATLSGILLGVSALLLALFYLIRYLLYGFGVPGFATIVILILVFSAIQLFCLGIMGEYVGRMHQEVKNRPEYIVRDKLGVE